MIIKILGLVDSDHFPNELCILAFNTQSDLDVALPKHSKIAQLLILPRPQIMLNELEFDKDLHSPFASSHPGFGSTGY